MSTTVAPEPDPRPASLPSQPARVNGWKEIAGRLGRGVRTAQRWEKLHGLPVHRIGREGGEIVFAFTAELDHWARVMRESGAADVAERPSAPAASPGEAEPAPPSAAQPASRRFRRLVPALALAALALPFVWGAGERRSREGMLLEIAPAAYRAPASWTLTNDVLRVVDANDEPLFERALGLDITGSAASVPTPPGSEGPVRIADVDSDGRSEVLLAAPSRSAAQRQLYCFESDGTLRFVHRARGSVRFGDTSFGEPWAAERVFTTRRANGSPSLWVVSAQPGGWPSWLQELGPDGSVRQQYLTDGNITQLAEARWRGADVVLVGGSDEDQGAASLAVFDRDAVAGSAPATRAGYDCTSCSLGGPRDFFVFPRLCLTPAGSAPRISEIWLQGGDSLVLATLHGREGGTLPGVPDLLRAHYVFNGAKALVHAEISRDYQIAHAALQRRGLVDHAYGPQDDARLFPVLRFDGRGFVPLPPTGVGH